MSKDKKAKLSREERKKRAVRIMAVILAFLMIAGAATYTIMMLASAVSAEEAAYSTTIDTSSLEDSGDVRVSVGLMYGSNITVGFQTTVTNGYTLGLQEMSGEKNFTPIWDLYTSSVSVTTDANLYKDYSGYQVAYGPEYTQVGGYHLEVHCDIYDRYGFTQLLESKRWEVEAYGLSAIPAYVYTGYALRVGSFSTYWEAEAQLATVSQIFPGHTVTVAHPNSTAVSVIDPYTNRIMFEFDCGGGYELGLKAKEDENGNTHIKTPAGNVYDGVFAFKRYNNGAIDGVSLINIIPLEAYIGGVLPYETSNTWPIETQKAFAIAVRSFTLTQLGKHGAENFDLCNTVHCQVYKGAGKINENVIRAIKGTHRQVLTYDGNIITAYYSSSTGGVTVDAEDAWGSSLAIPYLKALSTPWENYMTHNNAFWITEISPYELLDRLHQAGYTTLVEAVADVFVEEYANNSTYIKVLGVTDVYGNTVYIRNTDAVRTSLTPYVKSSNFVIGKGSVEYTESVQVQSDSGNSGSSSGSTQETPVLSYDKDFGYINISQYTVMTADGVRTGERTEEEVDGERHTNISILTGDDTVNYLKRDAFVMSVENAGAFLGEEYNYVESEENKSEGATEIIEDKSTEEVLYKIAYADNANNFIIVGKGWGHGVGMSQWGAYDLALLGKNAEEILHAYFTDVAIIDYSYAKNYKKYSDQY